MQSFADNNWPAVLLKYPVFIHNIEAGEYKENTEWAIVIHCRMPAATEELI
jgi:hypothetical protein